MRFKILTIVSVAALVAGLFAAFHHVDRNEVQPNRELSRMRSVTVLIGDALSSYHQQHGQYPRTLRELPLETLRWGDEGSSPRDVEAWSYVSDGKTFSMSWTNTRGMWLHLGGTNGQMSFSNSRPEDERAGE